MNKKEFIDSIAASRPNVSRAEVGRIVGTLVDAIGNEIRRGGQGADHRLRHLFDVATQGAKG